MEKMYCCFFTLDYKQQQKNKGLFEDFTISRNCHPKIRFRKTGSLLEQGYKAPDAWELFEDLPDPHNQQGFLSVKNSFAMFLRFL